MARQFLVLDDHPFVHTALGQMLADLEPGGRITLTHRLEQALSSLRQNPAPDLILADLHLPDANGTEVLTRLRQQRPEAPIAVFSAHADAPPSCAAWRPVPSATSPRPTAASAVINALRLITSAARTSRRRCSACTPTAAPGWKRTWPDRRPAPPGPDRSPDRCAG
jgi:DNA-binding NarL/FixJ family response regulator